ncbi:Rod shape-determining protein MreD [Tepidimonas alkaliphilus]|uniref:Rod shape-determining protein MreD n=1 Tax=Tepidimonas alkaliphilus TaxID=2588942 RepID=A0A554W521_9BURK|nr:Rod shape-determining protein MreD [Tepidimonas alkaliphilus]
MLPRGQVLLLPANPAFVWGSVAAALAWMMVQGAWLPRLAFLPDWLALTLTFWSVHQPRRIGVGTAFSAGLTLDVAYGTLLGQHALAYAVMSYGAIALHRRILWFELRGQTLHVLPLLLTASALQWGVRWLAGDGGPSWAQLLAPLTTAAAWPLAHYVLLAPQRRAPDPDDTRPL